MENQKKTKEFIKTGKRVVEREARALDLLEKSIEREGLLPVLFNESTASALLRSGFIGPNIHLPLIIVGFLIAVFSRTLGFLWLALMIVAAELLIVISRFVFSYEQTLMGDLVRYWYAALFLFASAYTLFDEGHVRVDVLYSTFKEKTKGKVRLRIYPGGVIGDERDMVRKMRIGQIQAAGMTAEGLSEIVSEFSGYFIPLVYQNSEDVRIVTEIGR